MAELDGVGGAALYNAVEQEVVLPQQVTGEDATIEVLCVLSQRITGGEASDLADALPAEVRRRIRQHGTRVHPEHPEVFGRDGFLERVTGRLQVTLDQAEVIARAVFTGVRGFLPAEAVRDVASQLPADIRELWIFPVAAAPATRPVDELTSPPPDAVASKVFQQIEESGVLPRGMSGQEAYCAAMCTLCRRLSRGDARHVYLALPRALQRLIEDCALVNRAEHPEVLDREQFVRRVAERLQVDRDHAEAITRTVFAAVETALPTKEIHDVAGQLPGELKDLWTDNPVALGRPAGAA